MLVGFALLIGFLVLVSVGVLFWYVLRLHKFNDRIIDLIDRLRIDNQGLLHYQNLVIRLHQELGHVTSQLQNLQQILQNPQRGRLVGETSLETILRDALPRPYFQLQYNFRNGTRVDAVVRIGDKLLPIDAKFPLESFQRLLQSSTDTERQQHAREFRQVILRHAESIQRKYILPDEGTLDFALMFVPSESIYYEIIAGTDGGELLREIQKRQVFPVSPNTLMVYIHIVARGIWSLNLERRVRRIIELLDTLDHGLQELIREYTTLIRHIRDAFNKGQSLVDRLEGLKDHVNRLRQIYTETNDESDGV